MSQGFLDSTEHRNPWDGVEMQTPKSPLWSVNDVSVKGLGLEHYLFVIAFAGLFV